MNRGAMKSLGRDILGETQGSQGSNSPFSWDTFLNQAADEIARATDSFYTSYTCSLVSGQAAYCATNLYKIKGATVLDSTGNTIYLSFASVDDMNRYRSQFINATTGAPNQGVPSYFVVEGANNIVLLPAPNYASTNGLRVEGYGTPWTGWAGDGTECPLPEYAHMAVVLRACLYRCMQYPTAENQARVGMIQSDFRYQKGQIEAANATMTSAQGHRPGVGDVAIAPPFTPLSL